MADEELHETDSNNQKDWQSETSSSTVADETASKDTEQNAENASAEEGAAYGVNMEQVQAVLNATADKATLTPQMQRMMNRQAENTKRVEETIKGTKSNPRWFVPLFCAFMIIGLIWCVAVSYTHLDVYKRQGTHRTPSAGSADRNGRHRHGHVRQSTAAPSDQHATHCFGGPGLKIGRE